MKMASLPSNNVFPELKNNASFNASAPTLEDLMLQGKAKDTWVDTCEKVGHLLATIRNNFNGIDDVAKVFPNESIRKQSVLGEWIEKINNSWDDAIKSFVPASRLNNLDSERMRARGKQAAELMGKGDSVNLYNLVTRNVQLLPDQQNVQINFNGMELVYSPLGLETAIFLADVLVRYHQQLQLEHNIRYVTSDCAKSFGRAFNSKVDSSDTDHKKFWAQTSLLAGWEIIRRVSEDETLREWSQRNEIDLADVFEAGLRLVYNGHIDNIGFMITVALCGLEQIFQLNYFQYQTWLRIL